MKTFDVLAAVLLVVGGLNWGLVALANFDLVAFVTGAGGFGAKNALGMLVYGLVGLAAVYQGLGWKAIQHVITSYSIHYTKLYEARSSMPRPQGSRIHIWTRGSST